MKTRQEVQAIINAKLALWVELYDGDYCENHRKEANEKSFPIFKELMAMAHADPELAAEMQHYREHSVSGNLPYTGCTGGVVELARERERREREERERGTLPAVIH